MAGMRQIVLNRRFIELGHNYNRGDFPDIVRQLKSGGCVHYLSTIYPLWQFIEVLKELGYPVE